MQLENRNIFVLIDMLLAQFCAIYFPYCWLAAPLRVEKKENGGF